jgi:hypothetical protein
VVLGHDTLRFMAKCNGLLKSTPLRNVEAICLLPAAGDKNAWTVAKKVEDAVYKEVQKLPRATLPNLL